jgi:hypothetical protein
MATVDITKGWRKYSKEDLLKFMDSGILVCGKFELDEFIQYMIDGVEESVYQRGYDQGYSDAEAHCEIMGSED